ncbi:hypothetical protein ACOWPH_00025 [Anabaena sp. PCC 7938]|uniref:DUF4384 domain-containing protein n=1 Tax=Anabaena cylindrica (strain ATCC 27899 / PCC 7122) TaxID=272123 RepID=K9ZC65_ANACC|nr:MULTISPECIES: hypothetical protein [Anabaena]AFZ56756.1 hypothetical protein Anacy_1214 [Anabaena cylindrica PCC 7122]MBY5283921.1 hypothetical protein [Anabaena sp. CCAP 1446/1C]MBY5309742.1 hypothetical protein [Anabaena sp. CCAP 1446/1C]MCM2409814.1 hypothetical protein [Anabaena sp. CCAP 1446/1C]BAY06320.1 hypothetical protein NIES19_56030 [Anabaena cylindrica PCC 7122]
MLQDKFLEQIKQQLYPRRRETYQELCFPLRWHPQNVTQSQGFIEEEMRKQLNVNIQGISQIISRVAYQIWEIFQEEMIADGFQLEKTNQQGQPRNEDQSPYRVTYKWLWEKKFPRMAWDLAKEVAEPVEDEIKMIPYDDDNSKVDRIMEDYIPKEETLQKKTKYRLKMNLDATGYLLLINESANGKKYLISPSKCFAEIPCYPLSQPLYLPPDNKNNRAPFGFNTEKELFLAIITKQEINLSWINENYTNKDIPLTEQRLLEIFQEVGKLSDFQVFQRMFRVN